LQANPLWPVNSRFPALREDIRKDVVVVGGGMAGVSSALQLRKVGFDVALIERDEVGGPATGASSGVLYYGSGTNLAPAVKLFGEQKAQMLWKETAAVIEQIVSTAEQGGIDCGLRTCGSIMVAKTDEEYLELEEEIAAMKKVGLPARLLSANEVRTYYPLREFKGGLAYDGVGQVHPARLAAGAARLAGLEIYESTQLTSWKQEWGGIVVETPKGRLRCADLVLATNKESIFGLERHFEFESSVILASRPTERVKDVFPTEKILWSMEEKYDLVYPRGDRLILELYALGQEQSKLSYYFPGVDFTMEHQWGEAWAKPPDWIPIVGKVSNHVWVAVGMGDQGIIMSWLSGSKMPMLIEGKSDWFTEMASPQRFGTAAAPTVQEEPLGEFEMVAKVKDIPQGKMKIAKLGGVEIAIGNIGGSFYAILNKCTHAGGPVGKGKLTGSVIQCPYHGSKFDVKTGTVVGPPAKAPLRVFQVKVDGDGVWVKSARKSDSLSW
jgi:glycine/D-amino acid oxidase-like deaminating enzyme/nitrite reductase/ring-hydroxylating ferredoxin subunit